MSHGLNQDSHKAWESGKGVFKESIMNGLSFKNYQYASPKKDNQFT